MEFVERKSVRSDEFVAILVVVVAVVGSVPLGIDSIASSLWMHHWMFAERDVNNRKIQIHYAWSLRFYHHYHHQQSHAQTQREKMSWWRM